MSIALGVVAGAVGAWSLRPIGKQLAVPITGLNVPVSGQQLVRYLFIDPRRFSVTPGGAVSPISEEQARSLRELSALTIGSGVAVGALTYVLLHRALS